MSERTDAATSACPRCDHEARFHPLDTRTGERICAVSLNMPPSCQVCAGSLVLLERETVSGSNGADQ